MFPAHTKILVQGKGYYPIENFSGQFVEIWDGEAYTNAKISEPKEAQICKIDFKGGHAIECSTSQEFFVITKKGVIKVKAKDLKYPNQIQLTKETPKYDFLQKVENYTTWEQGFCHGLVHTYSYNDTLIIPANEFELLKKFKEILYKNQIKYYTAIKHKNTKMDLIFTFAEKDFISEFSYNVPVEQFCKSKIFTEGYLKAYFNNAKANTSMLIKTAESNTNLKSLQSILYLFGIKSATTQGLMRDTLTICDESLLKLYETVPIFQNVKIINALDNNNVNVIWKRHLKPLTLSLANVKIENETSPMWDITESDTSKVMANGIVAYSQRSN